MENTVLHFFPFNTFIQKPVESFDNIQGLYVESYPQFLAELFSSLPNIEIYTYFNNLATDEETGETGFSNWNTDTLEYMAETRNNPIEGFGITGELILNEEYNSIINITIFDLQSKSILKNTRSEFHVDDFLSFAVNNTVSTIIRTCQLDGSVSIPESLLKKPAAFLIHLQIKDMLRKKAILPDLFTTERILDTFYKGFEEQPDFLVLLFMFLEFVDEMPGSERDEFNTIMSGIFNAAENKHQAAEAYFRRGLELHEKGHPDRAVHEYSKVIALNPGYVDAYYNRALINGREMNRYDQAVRDFTKVIELDPSIDDAYYNRAVTYYLLGRYHMAWDDVRKVQELGVEIDPVFMQQLRRVLGKE